MIKQTITYEDYNGVQRTEDAYFNINDVEFAQLESTYEGGFSAAIERVTKSENPSDGFNLFEAIVRKSYGIKSEDGKRLIKSKEITDAFMQSEAYNELFCTVIESNEAAEMFFNGVIGAKHVTKK